MSNHPSISDSDRFLEAISRAKEIVKKGRGCFSNRYFEDLKDTNPIKVIKRHLLFSNSFIDLDLKLKKLEGLARLMKERHCSDKCPSPAIGPNFKEKMRFNLLKRGVREQDVLDVKVGSYTRPEELLDRIKDMHERQGINYKVSCYIKNIVRDSNFELHSEEEEITLIAIGLYHLDLIKQPGYSNLSDKLSHFGLAQPPAESGIWFPLEYEGYNFKGEELLVGHKPVFMRAGKNAGKPLIFGSHLDKAGPALDMYSCPEKNWLQEYKFVFAKKDFN